jgi:prophage regulatory protein
MSTFLRVAQLASFPATEAKPARPGQRARKARPARPGRLPVSPATIWRWVADGRFPKPIRLGPQVSAWRIDDVLLWEARQGRAADAS